MVPDVQTVFTLVLLVALGSTACGGQEGEDRRSGTSGDSARSAATTPDDARQTGSGPDGGPDGPGHAGPPGAGSTTELPPTRECESPEPSWIWCDDFERDRLERYFEYVNPDGDSFVRAEGAGIRASHGMRTRFRPGQVDAGSLKLAFGRTPQRYFRPVDGGDERHREVFWRFYLRYEDGWIGGGGDKLTRASSFSSSDAWAQAMIAHVWSGSGSTRDVLVLDPASGTDRLGTVRTRRYNDFDRLRWLGNRAGRTPLFAPRGVGRWYCVEAHVRLNGPARDDGVFELWIDDRLDVRIDGLDWVGPYDAYGVNALFLENYWNDGAPRRQERYFDALVVSTERIGCGG